MATIPHVESFRPLPPRWCGPRQAEPTLLAVAGASVLTFAYWAPSWATYAAMGGTTAVVLVVREARIRARVRARMAARAADDQRLEPEGTP